MISNPVASELMLPTVRTGQCRVPTINGGRDTAVPCPRYHSDATGNDIMDCNKNPVSHQYLIESQTICGRNRVFLPARPILI